MEFWEKGNKEQTKEGDTNTQPLRTHNWAASTLLAWLTARREMGTQASSQYLNLKYCLHSLCPSLIHFSSITGHLLYRSLPGMVSKYTLAFSLKSLWGKGSEHRQWRATWASKEKERHDLWFTLLPRNTTMRPWMLPELYLNGIWRRWQVPDYPVGWLSLYKQDGSRKGISWFSEALLCSAHTWGCVTKHAGFSTDVGQIFWKFSSFTAKAGSGLVFYISLSWKLRNYPVWSLLSMTKQYDCWKESWMPPKSLLSLKPHSLPRFVSGHVYLIISTVDYSVMLGASSSHCSLFSGSFASHWDSGIFIMKHNHIRSWLLHGVFCLAYPDNFTSSSTCIAR